MVAPRAARPKRCGGAKVHGRLACTHSCTSSTLTPVQRSEAALACQNQRMSSPQWNVPDRIETERLVMRRYEHADAEALAVVIPRNIAHLERYMEWIKFEPQTVEQRREWIAHTHTEFDNGADYTLGIFDRATGDLIGGTGFHVRKDPERLDIGYWIDQDWEGKGLVTQAVAALTRVGLEYTQSPLMGVTHVPSNTRSAAIPERLGYERQADAGEACHESGEKIPSVVWRATAQTLTKEPLASTPRPALFTRGGVPLEWPA